MSQTSFVGGVSKKDLYRMLNDQVAVAKQRIDLCPNFLAVSKLIKTRDAVKPPPCNYSTELPA
jgi:hypothetical protein